MTPVFLDTVSLIATWDADDQWHASAAPVYNHMLSGRIPVVTSSLVLVECANAAARRPYRGTVVMRRLGITDVLSNDRHFKAAGFRTPF